MGDRAPAEIAALATAGLSSEQIAQQLNDAGVPVPRQAVTHYSHYRYEHPYVVPTDAGNPPRWTRRAVDAVKAGPEYDAADGYAVARSRLNPDTRTTLTVS